MSLGLIIGGVVLAIIVFAIIIMYNGLVRLRQQVKNAFAQIDVQLKRRTDLIPNLVETVKGYMKHEKDLLENITKARSAVMNATGVKEKSDASNMLSSTLKSLFAVSENYPNLKANENFMQLQEELIGTENKISYSRQNYNDMVMLLNTKIELFPTNIFAGMLGFTKEEMFLANEEERKNIKVKF
jgi:LemA protein